MPDEQAIVARAVDYVDVSLELVVFCGPQKSCCCEGPAVAHVAAPVFLENRQIALPFGDDLGDESHLEMTVFIHLCFCPLELFSCLNLYSIHGEK
ncbi:hypothetical protein [Zavarzinella formosa]|uniref:hypothetical protein n=1 Tax=Zavarzinella formosa TaxID=360055 RepID=UPI0012FB1AA1|nr:hypothetical protein [Zavarzinella formosa]